VFIDKEKTNYPVRILCRVMRVGRSSFYEYLRRRAAEDARKNGDAERVKKRFYYHRRRYGSRRLAKDLKMGRFLVRRLMREMNLVAIQPKRFKPKTTDSRHDKLISPNLLRECGLPLTWGEQIVGDITYLPLLGGGFVYLATFQDRLTKRLVGWSMADSLEADLVVKALQMALRRGLIKRGAIVHTDRGSQYVSNAYRSLLARCGLRQSMSGKGNCYDNAQAESFFLRFKAELVTADTHEPIRAFRDLAHARQEAFSYIEGYYNRIRLHSSIGYRSPIEFERQLKTKSERRSANQTFVSTFS
jgi:transposase InsO family protein